MTQEYTPSGLVAYYRHIEETGSSDFPGSSIEAKYHPSDNELIGFQQLWLAVHMRRQLQQLNLASRRELELDIREAMALLNREDAQELATWHTLHTIHHLSVTADQAELSAAAFTM